MKISDKPKAEIREQLEQQISEFFKKGGQITKLKPQEFSSDEPGGSFHLSTDDERGYSG